jgi:predicted Ser/Thr protein kinase
VEGRQLGRYVIEAELGKGGMGVVYRAHDERLGKTVALKVLAASGPLGTDTRKRLRQEARAAAILNHPSIVAVYDYDEQEGIPFIVYEYVQGETLERLIADGSLDEPSIIDIGIQIASGLEYAHERGILHRDIKPQNIIVTEQRTVKILDFGLAKRTRLEVEHEGPISEASLTATAAGSIVGTAQYMSPEQLAGETLDGRTDVFSLGVVLYEMAAGANPFQGNNFAAVVGKIMSPEPPSFPGRSLQVSEGLQDVLLHCLQKRRADRYPGMGMLIQDLKALQGAPARSGIRSSKGAASVIPRRFARTGMLLLQTLYLVLYGLALYHHLGVLGGVTRILTLPGIRVLLAYASPVFWASAFLTSACTGITVRLYLLASVAFDDPETGRQFRKLFPFVFLLDELWALSPLLLMERWPPGIALACMAVLAYLPMSQRTLIRSSYP